MGTPKRKAKRKRGSKGQPQNTAPDSATGSASPEAAPAPRVEENAAAPAPAPPAPFLVLLQGKAIAREFRLDRPTITIGRGEEADARLLEEGVSRLHARITVDGVTVSVEDLGSMNKTFVNGQEIAGPRALVEGDDVALGRAVRFRFTTRNNIEEEIRTALFDGARRDPLTGTFLRAYFDQCLRAEFSYAQRHGTELAVAMIEIDRLGEDKLLADELLAHLGARLRREAGEHLVARYEARTFAVLARAVGSDEGRTLGERIRRSVESAPFPVATSYVRAVASVGLATYPLPGIDLPNHLVAIADRALQEAKARGPNQVVVAEMGGGRAQG